jgi:tetratricopeptide (TPR) repeat protein
MNRRAVHRFVMRHRVNFATACPTSTFRGLRPSLRLEAKDAPAYFNRGTIYEKNGEFEKALVEYNLAIKLDPHLQGAVEGVKRIQQTLTSSRE